MPQDYLPETIELGAKALRNGLRSSNNTIENCVTAVLDAVGYRALVTEKELRQAAEADGFPPHQLRVVRAGYIEELEQKAFVHAEATNGLIPGYGSFDD